MSRIKDLTKTIRETLRPMVHAVVFDVVLPTAYRRAATEPVDKNVALFIEETKAEPSDNFTLMMQELENRGITCKFFSLGHYREGTGTYYRRCAQMAREVATAHYAFLCEASAPLSCLPLRKETKAVQLWHGCGAFKKFGMSTADKLFGDSREEKKRHPYYENLSLVTVSSPEVVWAYVEAMDLGKTPEIVRPIGISRTDVYFDDGFLAEQRRLVATQLPKTVGKKVILYAPTFRGRIAEAEGPIELDIELLRERLSDEYVLLIKHHPFVKRRPPVPSTCESFAFDISEVLSIEAAMAAADVCITDYSSLVYEYSLLRRPMAFFAFDKSDYDDWRGFYYDYDELTPGPVLTTTEQVAGWVDGLSEGFDLSEVDTFRDRFMTSCDGRSTERIADYVLSLGE